MIRSLPLIIESNTLQAPDIYCLALVSTETIPLKPGQFLELMIPGKSLRRPLSVAKVEGSRIEIYYKVVGEGTRILASLPAGTLLGALGPLGNGFTLPKEPTPILLIGGGIGTPPLRMLLQEALSKNFPVTVLFGFRSRKEKLFYEELSCLAEEASPLRPPLTVHYVYDEDGENVVSAMTRLGLNNLPFFACGPKPMLQALSGASLASGQCSLETRMGCGFGACMGCSIKTTEGMKRICKDGPVFSKEVILWDLLA